MKNLEPIDVKIHLLDGTEKTVPFDGIGVAGKILKIQAAEYFLANPGIRRIETMEGELLWAVKMIHEILNEPADAPIKKNPHSLQKTNIEEFLAKNTGQMEIAGFSVPCASVPDVWAGYAGFLLCEGHPFSATYYDTPSSRAYDLSSDGKVDVGKIAVRFGGTGSQYSAEFEVPFEAMHHSDFDAKNGKWTNHKSQQKPFYRRLYEWIERLFV